MQHCPYCRGERIAGRVRAREMILASREPYDYLVCAECGSVRLAAPPRPLHRFRAAPADPAEPARNGTAEAALARLLHPRLLRWLKPLLRDPPAWLWPLLSPDLQAVLYLCPSRDTRILDVGPASGAFLAGLRRLGFSCCAAVDADETGMAAIPGGHDLICLRHSLETAYDPGAALARAAAGLAPGGAVLVQVANPESPEFARWRGDWWGLQAPRHVALPTRRGLVHAAAAAGLTLTDRICTSRSDDYLTSREYNLDIAELDPHSWRSRGPGCPWRRRHLRDARRKAQRLNAAGGADRIAYVLRRNHDLGPPDTASPVQAESRRE